MESTYRQGLQALEGRINEAAQEILALQEGSAKQKRALENYFLAFIKEENNFEALKASLICLNTIIEDLEPNRSTERLVLHLIDKIWKRLPNDQNKIDIIVLMANSKKFDPNGKTKKVIFHDTKFKRDNRNTEFKLDNRIVHTKGRNRLERKSVELLRRTLRHSKDKINLLKYLWRQEIPVPSHFSIEVAAHFLKQGKKYSDGDINIQLMKKVLEYTKNSQSLKGERIFRDCCRELLFLKKDSSKVDYKDQNIEQLERTVTAAQKAFSLKKNKRMSVYSNPRFPKSLNELLVK